MWSPLSVLTDCSLDHDAAGTDKAPQVSRTRPMSRSKHCYATIVPSRGGYEAELGSADSGFAGRSGLTVACLTAVRDVLGSNRAVGSCVYLKNHCYLQPWTRAV